MFLPLPQPLPNSLLPLYPFNFMLYLSVNFCEFFSFFIIYSSPMYYIPTEVSLPLLLLIPPSPLPQLHSSSISLQERAGL